MECINSSLAPRSCLKQPRYVEFSPSGPTFPPASSLMEGIEMKQLEMGTYVERSHQTLVCKKEQATSSCDLGGYDKAYTIEKREFSTPLRDGEQSCSLPTKASEVNSRSNVIVLCTERNEKSYYIK